MSDPNAHSSHHAMVVRWSPEDDAFVAVLPELPGVSAFGSTREEAAAEAEIAAALAIEVLRQDGRAVPEAGVLESSSGQFRVRLPRSLHHDLVALAQVEGVSLNTLLVQKLSEVVTFAKCVARPPIRAANRSAHEASVRVPRSAAA